MNASNKILADFEVALAMIEESFEPEETCEDCGKPGELQTLGYLLDEPRLCPLCADKAIREAEAIEDTYDELDYTMRYRGL